MLATTRLSTLHERSDERILKASANARVAPSRAPFVQPSRELRTGSGTKPQTCFSLHICPPTTSLQRTLVRRRPLQPLSLGRSLLEPTPTAKVPPASQPDRAGFHANPTQHQCAAPVLSEATFINIQLLANRCLCPHNWPPLGPHSRA